MLPKQLQERIELLKTSGYLGGIIGTHRARTSVPLTRTILLTIFVLPVFFIMALWYSQDAITMLWYSIFEFWVDRLSLNAEVRLMNDTILYQPFVFPYPYVYTHIPDVTDKIICAITAVLCWIASIILMRKFAEKNLMPFAYLLRIAAFINVCTIIFFFWRPQGYFFTTEDYISGCLSLAYKYLYLLAPILGFTYNIFNIKIRYKVLLPAGMILYFLVFMPHLFLFHAYVVGKFSILYLPLLYLMFTFLPIMAMTVALYAFFLSFNTLPQSEYDG